MKISHKRLRRIADAILGNPVVSGRAIAAKLNIEYRTFWTYLRSRGMPTRHVERLANLLDKEATKLNTAARNLRKEVSRHQLGT